MIVTIIFMANMINPCLYASLAGIQSLLLKIIAAGPEAAGVQNAICKLNEHNTVKTSGLAPNCSAKVYMIGITINMIATLFANCVMIDAISMINIVNR